MTAPAANPLTRYGVERTSAAHSASDEREPRREEHLRGSERFLHAPRSRPEQPLQVDARFARRLRIEVVSPIDERRRIADGCRGRQSGEDDGEASARTAADELRQAAARQTSGE
jgi:hypothetical protein